MLENVSFEIFSLAAPDMAPTCWASNESASSAKILCIHRLIENTTFDNTKV